MKLEYYLKINYIQLTLAFEVLDLFSRGFPDFIAKRARLAPAAARGAFIPLQNPPRVPGTGMGTGELGFHGAGPGDVTLYACTHP